MIKPPNLTPEMVEQLKQQVKGFDIDSLDPQEIMSILRVVALLERFGIKFRGGHMDYTEYGVEFNLSLYKSFKTRKTPRLYRKKIRVVKAKKL